MGMTSFEVWKVSLVGVFSTREDARKAAREAIKAEREDILYCTIRKVNKA